MYAPAWSRILIKQNIGEAPANSLYILNLAKKELPSNQYQLVLRGAEHNHYYLCPENMAFSLASSDADIRSRTARKLKSILSNMDGFQYNKSRKFNPGKPEDFIHHQDLEKYMTEKTFESPLFSAYNSDDLFENKHQLLMFLNGIDLGGKPFLKYSGIPSTTRVTERAVKLMKKSKKSKKSMTERIRFCKSWMAHTTKYPGRKHWAKSFWAKNNEEFADFTSTDESSDE